MAGGLNRAFRTNASVFMGSHRLIVKTSRGHGPYFNTGVGDFDIVDSKSGAGACFVETFVDRTFRKGTAVRAFMLFGLTDNNNTHALPNTVNWMMTNDLSGCQFLAYGPSRNNLTVEHNNHFTGGAMAYNARYNLIAMQGHAVLLALRPVAGVPANANEYQMVMGANVVGVRQGDGWHFYVRRDTTQANAPVYDLP